jgi:hypothetical protein
VNRIGKALVNGHFFFSGNQVVGVRDNLLFHGTGHAVAGEESQERAFVSSEAGPGMAFHDPGKVLAKTHRSDKVCPALGMADIVGTAPAYIVEHRARCDKVKMYAGIPCRIPAGTVPHCPAVGDNFWAAAGIPQQVFAGFFLCIRHGQATF